MSNFFKIKISAAFLVRISGVFSLIIFAAGCAGKIHLQTETYERRSPAITEEIRSAQSLTDFKGSGAITIVTDGRRSAGKCDVRFKPDGSFKALVYSPFGSTAARIEADSAGGRLNAGKEEYAFGLDDSMEALPFGWGKFFTFRQFMRILIGKMPADAALLDTRPDSLTSDKSSAVAVWSRDLLTVEARIGKKSEAVQSVTFNYGFPEDSFTLSYGRFKKGAPCEIAIRSDSKNYILLKYDK